MLLLTSKIQEIVVLQAVDSLELTTNVELLGGREEILDTGVGVVITAEDELGLLDPVVLY